MAYAKAGASEEEQARRDKRVFFSLRTHHTSETWIDWQIRRDIQRLRDFETQRRFMAYMLGRRRPILDVMQDE